MPHEEVVLLDSDEEDSKEDIIRIDPIIGNGKPDSSITDDIAVEFNQNDYADLLTPMYRSGASSSFKATPTPTKTVQTQQFQPHMVLSPLNSRPVKTPKKPGHMPPFALFSKEKRETLQKENPHMGFAELGSTLGEMWHALKEEEKDDYRKRAKAVADARMQSWNETMKTQNED